MVKKIKKYLKFVVCCALIMSLMAPSYAALSASDGSAFVTKSEFDSALADFNARLTTFEAGINSKIDSQVTSYLDRNGIWNGTLQTLVWTEDKLTNAFSWRPTTTLTNSKYKSAKTNREYIIYNPTPNMAEMFPGEKQVTKTVNYMRNKICEFTANKSGLLFWNYGGMGGTFVLWFGGWGWSDLNGTWPNASGYFYTASYDVGIFEENGTAKIQRGKWYDKTKLINKSNNNELFIGMQGSEGKNEEVRVLPDDFTFFCPDATESQQQYDGWDDGMTKHPYGTSYKLAVVNAKALFSTSYAINLGAPPRTLFCFVQKNKTYSLFTYNQFLFYINNYDETRKEGMQFTFMDTGAGNGNGAVSAKNLDVYKWYVY